VCDPTRITEHSSNILDLFFTNNSSLINTTEVIPGISDHEAVYVEASLRPHRAQPVKRKAFTYQKANYNDLNKGLRDLYTEMTGLQNAPTHTLWSLFKNSLVSLMERHIPTKVIKEDHKKKPWINKTLKRAMRRRSKLYTRMKKTGKAQDINKYKHFKSQF